MSEWFTAWLPFLIALLIVTLPGLCVGLAAGLRSMAVVSLAPLLSLGVLSVSAIQAPLLGLGWGPVPVAVGTLVTGLATGALRAVVGRKLGYDRGNLGFCYRPSVVSVAGLGVAGAVILYRLARIFAEPSYVSQTADNVFHLNAVRYVLDTSDASSLTLGAASGGTPSFYPAAWHGLAGLIVQMSGSPIPVAVACLNLVIGCLIWPLSMWFLCRTLFGGSAVVNVAFAVLVGSFSAYPYLLIDWGVIYPNYLGLAALPAVLGLVVLLFRTERGAAHRGTALTWVGLIGLAGVTLSHPNSLLTLVVLAMPYVVARLVRSGFLSRTRLKSRPSGVVRLALVAASAAAVVVAWVVLRPFPFTSFNITWPPYQSAAQAVGETILTTHSGRNAAWATGILLLVGLWSAYAHRGYRWMAWSFGAWVILFVAVTAWQPSTVRAFLTGGWYDDFKRVAAGSVLITLPLAVLGFVVLYRILRKGFSRMRMPGGVATVVCLALLAAPTAIWAHTGPIRTAAVEANKNYNLRPGSPIMSSDEQELYSELPDLVPSGDVIAGNPWDGSAWAYMVSGRHVLYPHVIPFMNEDKDLIAEALRDAQKDPEVCAAAERLNVKYVITSDELIYLPGNPNNTKYPGLEHLDQAPGFVEVARVGANRLYKLEDC